MPKLECILQCKIYTLYYYIAIVCYVANMKMKTVCGTEFIIDSQDFEKVSGHRWHLTKSGHVYCSKNAKTLFIHSLILNHTPTSLSVCDHINLNSLDNRKSNLRITNKSVNSLNKGKNKYKHKTASIYKGVSSNRTNSFRSYASYMGRRYHIENHDCEKEAAKAYNLWVLMNVKESVLLNKIDGCEYDFFIPFPEVKNIWHDDLHVFKRSNSYRLVIRLRNNKLIDITTKNASKLKQIRTLFYLILLRNYYECSSEYEQHLSYVKKLTFFDHC